MITAQIEPLQGAWPELVPLFGRHWNDLALLPDRIPLAPQRDEYFRREQAGIMTLATVRCDGNIVAYYTVQVAPGLHYGATLTAHMDLMYIVPEMKGRGLALPLLRCVQRELQRRQAQIWYAGWKTNKPQGMERLHDLFGFVPADTHVIKWIGA